MADSLSDGELVARLMALKQYKGNHTAAARSMGIKPSAFHQSCRDAKARGLTAESKVVDEVARWKTKAKMLETQLAAIERHNIEAAEIRQTLYSLSANTPDPPKWVINYSKGHSSGIPCFHWSDWHHGEMVNRAQMGGANKFNREISKKRVRRLVETSIDLAKHHMTQPKYPGAVVCLGGDMITGAIHEELAQTNDGSVQQSVLEVEEMLIEALEHMAKAFGRLVVSCVVGNHARGTPKPRFKNHVVMSHEWSIYCRLEKWFQRDKRIQFIIPEGSDAYFSVCGHRYLHTHGDMLGVKGGDGIIGVLGPITRGTIKTGRQQAQIGRDFDTLIGGHFHTYIPRSDGCPAMFNGSLIGPSEYGHYGLRVPPSRPCQSLWFTHPTYGVTCQWPIYLEDKQNSMKQAPWVQWQGKIAA